MDRPSLSSPRRDVPAPQDDEIELIASQMEWHNDQSGNKHSDEQSGDKQGRVEGLGAWQGNEWLDPADPHPVPQRERRSKEAIDLDYEPEERQEARTGRSKRRPRPLAQQRKAMKALVRTQQPLTAKTTGDEVSEEGTSTLKGSSQLMQLAQQESP